MKSFLKKLKASEEGATIVEYGLIAAIIAIGLIGVWRQIGFDLKPIFQFIAGEIEEEVNESQN